MKTVKLLTFILLLTLSVMAEDIRVVNGRRIDLDALTNNVWKTIRIKAIAANGAYYKVTAIIGGENKVINIKNIPASITKAFAEPIKLAAEVAKLEAYVDSEFKRLRRLEANTPGTAAGGTYGGAQIDSYNNALVDLAEKRERLDDLKAKLAAANKAAAANSSERAYFTGQQYGGLEVWDCGIKVAK